MALRIQLCARKYNIKLVFLFVDEANNKILFISNLSPLVGAKEHLAELIRLFGIIGKLAEVIVLDNNLERGGAFVIYKKAENAQKAIRILQNYNILGSVIVSN